jgi:hypothetical protein
MTLRSAAKSIQSMVAPLLDDVLTKLFPFFNKRLDMAAGNSRLGQLILAQEYARIREGVCDQRKFNDVEFRCFSQNGEDGILLYIFSLIGTTNRKCVEMCAGDGIECNTANLIVNHGWVGLLVDGIASNVRRGRAFYSRCRDTFVWPPRLVRQWITAENVNQILLDSGFCGEIDLLSLDLDGVDYWIWRAIEAVRPRVVVLEFNDIWGVERSVTVPYAPRFAAKFGQHGAEYFGASLPAFVKLGRDKGYRLVGSGRFGNAFFLRNDTGLSLLPEIDPAKCLEHPRTKFGMERRLPTLRHRDWQEV